jgi:hypothetical protein
VRIPRWTTYPAIAVLLIVAITAIPRSGGVEEEGAAMRARAESAVAGILPPDSSRGAADWNPRITHGDQPPTEGAWNAGDILYNTHCIDEDTLGWICIESGSPGLWDPFCTN